jgi:CRP-like cAMP-binding protein
MRKILYLLGQMSDSDVEWMVQNGRKEHRPAGDVLIREGQPIEALYVVLAGALEVTGPGLDSKNPIRLGCGEVVGEVSFVDARPPMATVKAAVDSDVLAIPRPRLKEKIDQAPEFAARFYRSLAVFLAHRLRDTTRRLGYARGQPLDEEEEYAGELADEILDNLHMAGNRFDRVLQQLLTESSN